jgi:hypothetical protein
VHKHGRNIEPLNLNISIPAMIKAPCFRSFSLLLLLLSFHAPAQITFTWTGNTSNYGTPLNWNPIGIPGSNDIIVFTSASSVNCNFSTAKTLTGLTIMAGYNGTVTAAGVSTITNFTQGGGTFNCTSGLDLVIKGSFLYTGGTFRHNNGSVSVDVGSGATSTISGAVTFNTLNIKSTAAGSVQRTIVFGSPTTATLSLQHGANPFAYQGNVNVSRLLTVAGTNTAASTGNTGTITLNGTAGTINSSATAGASRLPSVALNLSGALSLTGYISVAGSWTSSLTGSFIAGTSTVAFYGTASNINKGDFDNLYVTPGASVTIGTTHVKIGGNLVHDGSLNTGTGLITLNGSGAQSVSGTATLTTFNALQVTGAGSKSLAHACHILDSLKVSAVTLVTSNNLTLKSTSALKGRIAQIVGAGSVSGNVTVETFAPGGTTSWAMLGSAGVSGVKVSDWEPQIPMTCSFCPYGVYGTGIYFVSILGWDENALNGSSLAYVEQVFTSPINTATGYWVYLGKSSGTTTAMTWSVTGPAVTGTVGMPLSYSGIAKGNGYNLVANPYPSPISWSKLRNGNPAVDDAVYVFNADLGLMTSYVSGVSTPAGAGSASDIIPMGQGFFVRAASPTSLTATEAIKSPANTSANQLLRTSGTNDLLRLRIVDADGAFDETVFRFEPSATEDFDQHWDAEKFTPFQNAPPPPYAKKAPPFISSRLKNVNYAINSLPPGEPAVTVPLLTKVSVPAIYTISATEFPGTFSAIYIHDRLLNTYHNLSQGNYVTHLSDTMQTPRFEVVAGNQPLSSAGDAPFNRKPFIVRQDASGIEVITALREDQEYRIVIKNILGQVVAETVGSACGNCPARIELPLHNELLFVSVTSQGETFTSKIIR